jgi:hypothetical protein
MLTNVSIKQTILKSGVLLLLVQRIKTTPLNSTPTAVQQLHTTEKKAHLP